MAGRQSSARPIKRPAEEQIASSKNFFWEEEEVIMQLHPAKSQYVNYHPNCLHLWRPMHMSIPQPPSILVGPK
jgi:hypothetical protein